MNTHTTTNHTIGYIGLGNMGAAMVRRLLDAGYTVHAWARRPETATAWADTPVRFHDSIQSLCGAVDLIGLNVTRTEDVEELLFREDGLFNHAQPGSLIIDFSTIDAARVRSFTAKLQSKGITYLDSPVSGGVMGAQAGTLAIMVGGPAAGFNRVQGLLPHLGKTIRHVGENGAGQAIKAANQMALCIQLCGIAEAMNYALEQGADLGVTLEVLQAGLCGSKVLDWAGPHMVDGFARPPTIQAHLHAKDVDMVAKAAKAQGLNLPLLYSTADLLNTLVAQGPSSQDTSRVFSVVRERLQQG
ncbi:MAG: NAD(P)-dependent oxidoreductase [Limnobacter sp.]|uniref:NAD(P)-dependent oxidoreductase n=1 Tax=Limnobacter sp. TaxID=2003368 RepID=UPI00391D32EE